MLATSVALGCGNSMRTAPRFGRPRACFTRMKSVPSSQKIPKISQKVPFISAGKLHSDHMEIVFDHNTESLCRSRNKNHCRHAQTAHSGLSSNAEAKALARRRCWRYSESNCRSEMLKFQVDRPHQSYFSSFNFLRSSNKISDNLRRPRLQPVHIGTSYHTMLVSIY